MLSLKLPISRTSSPFSHFAEDIHNTSGIFVLILKHFFENSYAPHLLMNLKTRLGRYFLDVIHNG